MIVIINETSNGECQVTKSARVGELCVHVESLYLYAMTVYYSILKMSVQGFIKAKGLKPGTPITR